jgi:predicted DCC family thiol-disulfide oxidoreductase YuxK
MSNSPQALWLVYDGDCPFCTAGASMYRLRQSVGELHIVNAREIEGTELMAAIRAHGFDLNTGFVARFDGRLYHGKDALHLLALPGSTQGWLNRLNVALFRFRPAIDLLYPVMVGLRSLLL